MKGERKGDGYQLGLGNVHNLFLVERFYLLLLGELLGLE